MPMIRVAFILGSVGWTGGINYYKNLLIAIKENPDSCIQPVLFFGLKDDTSEFEGLGEMIKSPLFDKFSVVWWLGQLNKRVGKDYILYQILKKHRISLLSHNHWLWKGCDIPSLGWIPDFQHLHLPEFCSQKELNLRDKVFHRMLRKQPAILVSSHDALKDLEEFSSHQHPPAYVLQFTSCLNVEKITLPSRKEITQKYKLSKDFFYIPNQFWQHKNHGVVIDALQLFHKVGEECPLVVCSGNTNDYRNPSYFPSLTQKISDLHLEDDMLILGKIPYLDVMALMKYSVAVVNPSLFEGWNTAVEEAKAMGKAVVLSDISVHLEQSPERGCYFKAKSEESLKDKMIEILNDFDERKEEIFMAEAMDKRKELVFAFAQTYENIVANILTGQSMSSRGQPSSSSRGQPA